MPSISSRNEELYYRKTAMFYSSHTAKKQEMATSSTKEEKEDPLFRLTSQTRDVYQASECQLLYRSPLTETDIDFQDDEEYLDLPAELVIRSTDIDTEEGEEVLQAEDLLSKTPITTEQELKAIVDDMVKNGSKRCMEKEAMSVSLTNKRLYGHASIASSI
ncbi:hypothetical protein CU098_005475 [Rhizopus stolonifer]|uniref:Uncharacterized protein n=1 Tax=Rhizopus stolonifer TaxID=4846 RepID=A0A367J430_RHIST|nr:hypothetical protein CU098_005475 [Rhizopus stolonifer]